jgi:putative transposase
MPRQARKAPGGLVYHVLNRGVGRQALFKDDADFAAFVRAMADVMSDEPIRVLGYCVMRNHWHLILWPERDGQLARFMQRLTVTHVRRWVVHRRRVGWGSVYGGRYKSFAVQDDEHLLNVLRYVERSPVRAGIVDDVRRWRWSSLGQAMLASDPAVPNVALATWPVPRRRDWAAWVNRPQSAKEELALRRAINHDRPFGDDAWVATTERRLELPPLRPRGRPRKEQ